MFGRAFSACMCLRGGLRLTSCAFHSHPPLNFLKQGLLFIRELVAWANPVRQVALLSGQAHSACLWILILAGQAFYPLCHFASLGIDS